MWKAPLFINDDTNWPGRTTKTWLCHVTFKSETPQTLKKTKMQSFYGVMVQINISNTLSYFQLFIAPLHFKKIRSIKIKEKKCRAVSAFWFANVLPTQQHPHTLQDWTFFSKRRSDLSTGMANGQKRKTLRRSPLSLTSGVGHYPP